jgi:hypothetical protein
MEKWDLNYSLFSIVNLDELYKNKSYFSEVDWYVCAGLCFLRGGSDCSHFGSTVKVSLPLVKMYFLPIFRILVSPSSNILVPHVLFTAASIHLLFLPAL